RRDLQDAHRLPSSRALGTEMEDAAVLAAQPGGGAVVGAPVAPAAEMGGADLLGARVGGDDDFLAGEEEGRAEERREEAERQRQPQRAYTQGEQTDQLSAPRELGDEERGGDDQRGRRELVGDDRGFVRVQLGGGLRPAGAGEAVGA